MSEHMSYFQATDGTTLYYRDHGDGPPIVLLSSQGLSSSMWQHLMVRLADRGFRCVALDRRGHGRSDDPGKGYDFDRFADDIGELLIQLDLRDVMLVGHSVGGAEAARYLTRHAADRVSRLVLASTTLPFLARTADNPDGVPLAVMQSVWDAWHSDWPRWVGENRPPFIGAGLPGCALSPEMIQLGMNDMLQTSLPALLQTSRAAVTTDFRAELPEIGVPTLLIHGDSDASTPVEITGAKAVTLIPGARLKIYQNAPHGLVATHLSQVEGDIVEFAAAPVAL
ncbi:MAG TPA: alpha/beta hydrolase [Streptosporangiaceae bacterium]